MPSHTACSLDILRLPGLQVGVEDAHLKGRVRMTLRPLLNRMPVVGAVQVSGNSPPEAVHWVGCAHSNKIVVAVAAGHRPT